jgi:competence protein ComEC
VTFLDVGQGDAAVIESPGGKVVVVDGGGHPGTDERTGDDPGTRVVAPFLRSRGHNAVDWLVATHPDDDHAQGLIAVTRGFAVRAALVNGYPGESAPYQRLLESLRARNVPVRVARRGARIPLDGGAYLEILHPGDRPLVGTRSDANENSVVLRLVYGRARVLFTGDAGDAAEADLLRANVDLSADVLKAGHHGSRWSTTDAFLARVAPTAAILSAGASNTFGHPSREVLDRLRRRAIRAFRTDTQGAITVETDGRTVRVWGFREAEKR